MRAPPDLTHSSCVLAAVLRQLIMRKAKCHELARIVHVIVLRERAGS